jgi:hypothetical protein
LRPSGFFPRVSGSIEHVPPKGFKRLIPDGEVRLRHAYVIKCDEVIKDANGEVIFTINIDFLS